MAYLDDPFKGQLAQLRRDVEKLKRRTTLNSAAIGRSGMEVYDQGVLNISNGTLIVNGYAQISGSLVVSGTSTFSGSLTIAGPTGITGSLTIAGPTGITGPLTVQGVTTISGKLDVTGPTTLAGTLDITGNTNITGTLGIKGDATLTGNMDVTGGGKIKIGTNMTLTPATDGGAITFQGGAKVSSVGGTVSMSGAGGVSSIVAGLTSVGISSGNAHYVAFNDGSWDMGTTAAGLVSMAGGVQVRGNLTVPGVIKAGAASELSQTRLRVGALPTTSTGTANVHVDSNGIFYRVSS